MAILVLESSKIDCLSDIINDLKNRMQELFTEFNPEVETFAEYNSEAKH